MLKTKIKLTYADYVALPDEKRYELIEGDLYMVPAPGFYHQVVSRNIEMALWDFVKSHRLGVVLDAPVDVVLTQEDVVQPDILFISNERRSIITEKYLSGAPDLIIEILSPSSMERDKLVKRNLYAEHGVSEYWIVNPVGKQIEVLLLKSHAFVLYGIFLIDDRLTSPLLPGFELSLESVFEPA
ncbi:MAG: Uma2 family endonuclease [Candidatus Manganitrophus sp. SA1]|nr:Uma2 family endonuclease [Candidatus Manganitrophus morganii]